MTERTAEVDSSAQKDRMPVMRASRPSAKQKVGDTLYEQLKGVHGKLAGKIVGMLLEGLPHEQLHFLCASPDDLATTVAKAVPLLERSSLYKSVKKLLVKKKQIPISTSLYSHTMSALAPVSLLSRRRMAV